MTLMWERQLDANTSLKFGPFFNTASNILETGPPVSRYTHPPVWRSSSRPHRDVRNCGVRKAFGVEPGQPSRSAGDRRLVVAGGDVRLLTNTTEFVEHAVRRRLDPAERTWDPGPLVAEAATVIASFTAGIHQDDFHLRSSIGSRPSRSTPDRSRHRSDQRCGDRDPHLTIPWAQFNATATWDVGSRRDITIGVQGMNILNNNQPVVPCTTSAPIVAANLGTGCGGSLRPIGINNTIPGVNGPGLQYATLGQSSPLYLFFISKKF